MPMDWIMFDDMNAKEYGRGKEVSMMTQAPLFQMGSPLNGVSLNAMRLQKIPGGPKVPNVM